MVISCGNEPHESKIHEPCFIVEVPSKTTAEKDRREKLDAYFKIPTLKTYVLVSQDVKWVEVYQKTRWNLIWSELVNEGTLEIPCLEESIGLEHICAGLAVPDVTE